MTYADGRKSTVERALEIARLGTASSIPEILSQLREEHYQNVEAETGGLAVKEQLKKLIGSRLARTSNV